LLFQYRHVLAIDLAWLNEAILTIQKLLGHSDVRTTMISTHVIKRGALGARSPPGALG